MSGYFVGGLGDGFMQGFNAVETWKNNRDEKARQKALDAENKQYKDAALDLQQQQIGLAQAKQTADQAETTARLGILSEGLGLDKRKVGLAEAQLPLERQRLQNQTAESQANIGINLQRLTLAQHAASREDSAQWYANQEASFKLREAGRVERLKQAQSELYPKLMAGTFDAADAEKWQKATGLNLQDVMNDGFVDNAVGLFHGVKTGQVQLNDPRLKPIMQGLYGSYFQRGIGEKITPMDDNGQPHGPEITVTAKEPHEAFRAKDGNLGFHVLVTGKDKDGNEHRFISQATRYGTGDPRDPIITIDPNTLEKPLVAAMHMNDAFTKDPTLRATVQKALGMEKDTSALQADKLRAETGKLKAEGEKAGAEAEVIKGGEKGHEEKMKEVRALVSSRFGGKFDPISNSVIGADTKAVDSILPNAEKLLREDKKLSPSEAYGKALEGYKAAAPGNAADEIKAQFKAGKISRSEAEKQLKALGFD